MGDPSGIGPEIIIKALGSSELYDLADFVVIGDSFVLNEVSKCQDFALIDLKNVAPKAFGFGKIRAEYGRAAIEYLNQGLALIKSQKIDCLVTAPVNKKAVNLSGQGFAGHTEYIADFFGVKDFEMMLFNQKLKVSLVTRHLPLKEVAKGLNQERIFKTILNSARGLRSWFGIRNPKIAVCGLNPHASDNGTIGDEEKCLIAPAIAKAAQKRILVRGPFPADTLFEKALSLKFDASTALSVNPERSRRIDCIVAMYHDQGLIPLKLTGRSDVVNITLGLPFVRTSPGHGTALDIAGKNKADPHSFIQAVKAAVQCTYNLKKA